MKEQLDLYKKLGYGFWENMYVMVERDGIQGLVILQSPGGIVLKRIIAVGIGAGIGIGATLLYYKNKKNM